MTITIAVGTDTTEVPETTVTVMVVTVMVTITPATITEIMVIRIMVTSREKTVTTDILDHLATAVILAIPKTPAGSRHGLNMNGHHMTVRTIIISRR